MAVASRRSKYGSLNWDEHQSRLRRLYLDEDGTLTDIMEIMKRDYNFTPSKSAYKRQFTLWGWHKNLTPNLARSMESKAKKRQRDDGKDTIFTLGGRQFTTTEIEQVVARSKRRRTTDREDVGGSTTPVGVTCTTPVGSTESPVPGASDDFRPDDASPATRFELSQRTDALANAHVMIHVPIASDSDNSAGALELASRRVSDDWGHELGRWARYGESSRQSWSGVSLCSEARPAVLQDPFLENIDLDAPWLTDELPSPRRFAMLQDPLLENINLGTPRLTDELPSPRRFAMLKDPLLENIDLGTPRLTDELCSPSGASLRSFELSSPPPINPPNQLMTRSPFALHFTGSPWFLFQRATCIPTLSTNADTSMPPLQELRELTARDIQSSLSGLAYSMLPHANGSTAARNLHSALEHMFSHYFPVDETQNLQLLLAASGNSFIDQLVAMTFGMVANGVLTEGELEQLLNMMKNYAPKALLRRLLTSETSTARSASEKLLKSVARRGDQEALTFLLDIGIRKERLSGTEGGVLLRCAINAGETEMAKRIALAGANPNYEDSFMTPLLWAIEVHDLDFVEILLEAGAEVDRPYGDSPETPLSIAVEENYVPCVSMLLESGATVDKSTVSDNKGWYDMYWSGPPLAVLDYAYLMGYTTTYRLLLARSSRAESRLTISGILGAARAGPNQLEAYLEKRASDSGEERTALLENALVSAIRHNTRDMAIAVLLDFNVHPDTPTLERSDQFPLCQAIPNVDLVERLIDAGADLERPEVILSAASCEENFDCLGHLIAAGLNLQALGSVGLGQAIWEGNMDIMKLLLQSGAPATGCDRDGSCLAGVAAWNGNREALQLLLQHGADVNGAMQDGSRPIHSAMFKADLEVVKLLVENGAHLDHSGLRGNGFGTVLEEWAMSEDNLRISDVFTYLLENGAPVNAPEVIRGALRRNSLLTILIRKSARDDLIRQVLEKGARVNEIRLPNIPEARTPIQAAAEMGKLDLVRELYEKGANINAAPGLKLGRTALQAACNAERANMELVVYLLDNGADINAKAGCNGGLTAIQGAAIQGNIKLVDLLMKRGADLNSDPAIRNGRTALDGAAEHGRLDMVHLLLSAGARCEREGLSGYDSAIKLAKEEGHWEVADLLAKGPRALMDENTY